jgi:HTH-type transcriptional regulator / antitoxin HigA
MDSERNFQPNWVSAPGETIADILAQSGVPPVAFAAQIGSSPEQVNDLLQGRAELTTETAALLATYLGASRDFWLNRESDYRLDLVRLGRETQGNRGRDWLRELPLPDMIRLGWLERAADLSAQVTTCLRFFGVPDERTWHQIYRQPLEMAAFRTSATFDSHPGAIATWLRRGEIEAHAIRCQVWNEEQLRALLPTLRLLTRQKDPARFVPRLVELCAACGVAVVVLRAPSGCRASGATRFLAPDKALLLLSFRYLSDDHFWFTFFHEVGHLLLHGQHALFLEGSDMLTNVDEKEANDFAADVLIPKDYRAEFDNLPPIYRDVIRFARRLGVAPGVIVGQLQHRGLLRRDQLNRLKKRFTWNHE